MNKRLIVLFIAFCSGIMLIAQEKKISLPEIWDETFETQDLEELQSMKNGKQYTVLNKDSDTGYTSVDLYDYITQEKIVSIASSAEIAAIDSIISYSFSKDESNMLLATELEAIYRHSKLGIYYVYDLHTKEAIKLTDHKIKEPTFSPDGTKVAYVSRNNIFIVNLLDGTTRQITTDGENNKIINGITDWVYEEEFAFVRAYEWNSDGTTIAFLRFDETNVPQFSMDIYGTKIYPEQSRFKYPKAGEENAKVSLHLYQIDTGSITKVDLGEAYYIPRIKWMQDSNSLSVQTINRHQNHLKLYAVDTDDNTTELLMEEKDAAYVDISNDLTFLADDSFIWTSERDGYNHIYLYASDGKLKNQVTKGPWEVTSYYGYDQKRESVFYQSTENGSINRDVYSIDSNGRNKKRLTEKEGTNKADFSADYTYFINTFSSATTPPEYTLNEALGGKTLKQIKNNNLLKNKLKSYELSPKEFTTISVNGNDLNMYMIKPKDFDPSKKYPLFMYQYSGPGSQKVANSWIGTKDYWHQMLASEGYIVACVDGRGTGYKGRDFKKVTYLNLVKYETEDQISAARQLSEIPYIDEERTGIWGWSFGGHMATNSLLKGNDVFEVGIAVAPVTSWRLYDTVYTERFMRTPAENPEGYDDNSPYNYPELLKGKYLLVHGSGDDNVHLQNTMRMAEALIQANKQFEWAIYPDKNHSIKGGNTSLHLYTKMTDFIHKNLGDKRGEKAKIPEKEPIKG